MALWSKRWEAVGKGHSGRRAGDREKWICSTRRSLEKSMNPIIIEANRKTNLLWQYIHNTVLRLICQHYVCLAVVHGICSSVINDADFSLPTSDIQHPPPKKKLACT